MCFQKFVNEKKTARFFSKFGENSPWNIFEKSMNFSFFEKFLKKCFRELLLLKSIRRFLQKFSQKFFRGFLHNFWNALVMVSPPGCQHWEFDAIKVLANKKKKIFYFFHCWYLLGALNRNVNSNHSIDGDTFETMEEFVDLSSLLVADKNESREILRHIIGRSRGSRRNCEALLITDDPNVPCRAH